MLKLNFKVSLSDQTLFIYIEEGATLYFLVYVGNIVLTSSFDEFVNSMIGSLEEALVIKDLGLLRNFLGIHITPLPCDDMFISQ